MKRQIEIFTAGCPVCEPLVQLVKDTADKTCEITIHNLSEQTRIEVGMFKMEKYGLKRLPALAVDGKLLDCCNHRAITREDLVMVGIGTSA